MNTLVDSAVLIPSLPILSAFLVAILLVSFNRTINRLTKPISFLLINSLLLSTLYSALLLFKHISAKSSVHPLGLLNNDYTLYFNINKSSEIFLTLIGTIALIIMTFSYIRLPRLKGYIRYLASLSFLFGILFVFILSNSFTTFKFLTFIN